MVCMARGPCVCLMYSMARAPGRSASNIMASNTRMKQDLPNPSVQLEGQEVQCVNTKPAISTAGGRTVQLCVNIARVPGRGRV